MPQKLELRYLLDQISPVYQNLGNEAHSGTIHELDILVLWHQTNDYVNKPAVLQIETNNANIQYFEKPINADEVRNIFSEHGFAR